MTDEARRIFNLMGDGMRLIVAVGDRDLRLIPDKRFGCEHPEQIVEFDPCHELVRMGLISALPKVTSQFKRGEGGKIGWTEMGFADKVPEGAEVYAVTQ